MLSIYCVIYKLRCFAAEFIKGIILLRHLYASFDGSGGVGVAQGVHTGEDQIPEDKLLFGAGASVNVGQNLIQILRLLTGVTGIVETAQNVIGTLGQMDRTVGSFLFARKGKPMQQINYTTLADFFKLFYSVCDGGHLTQTDSSRLINCSKACRLTRRLPSPTWRHFETRMLICRGTEFPLDSL